MAKTTDGGLPQKQAPRWHRHNRPPLRAAQTDTKKQAAAEKIKDLEEACGDAWETVKETADKVWDELRAGLASTVAKFK